MTMNVTIPRWARYFSRSLGFFANDLLSDSNLAHNLLWRYWTM